MTTFADALALVGLTLTETGGGCTALELRHSDTSYSLITVNYPDGDPCFAPESLDEPVLVGFYDTEGDEDATFTEFATLRDAIADIYGPIADDVR